MSKGIFHDLILEEYERSNRKVTDVVGDKRANYNDLLTKANECLKLCDYERAKDFYNQVVNLVDGDPYPDEYNLEENALFCLKCCLCYSDIQLCIHEEKLMKAGSRTTEKLIDSLIQLYPTTIMPYYLKLLFESRKSK